MELKFVSYDGEYPNLCSGVLIMELDGKEIEFPEYCLSSTGSCGFDSEWNEIIEKGDWIIIEFPENFPENLKSKAIELVNENVRKGCCGGCL